MNSLVAVILSIICALSMVRWAIMEPENTISKAIYLQMAAACLILAMLYIIYEKLDSIYWMLKRREPNDNRSH